MDLTGSSLNYKGLEVLQEVESGRKKYYRGGVIPCTADLKRAAQKLESKGNELVPFEEFQSEWGKGIKFCEARSLRMVCDAHSVTANAATSSVAISESIDAAQITKNMYFITAGFKMCNADAVDPVSKQPLCVEGLYSNVQSWNNVFPTQIMIAKETKESYEAFKSFFNFFAMASDKTISRDGTPYFWEALDGFQEINLTATMDMSAQWKGLQKGGACKQSRFFCHCCTVESKHVHHPNDTKCNRFCADRLDEDWLCYHHDITTNEAIQNMKDDIIVLQSKLSETLHQIQEASKVTSYSETHRGHFSDRHSIDYIPSGIEDIENFTEFLCDELELRSLDMTGSLEQMRQRLKESLQHESRLRVLLDQVSQSEGVGIALFLAMQAVPCILHCENHVILKVITMLLIEGFSNAKAGLILNHISATNKKRCIEEYINQMQNIINKEILGDEFDPLHWECPMNEEGNAIGTITLDNNRCQIILSNMERLIELSVSTPEQKEMYLFAVRKLNAATLIMRQRRDYSDEDICTFQQSIDDFFQVWVQMHGVSGCTNYIHMLSSGHVAEYMFHWRNLHRFSQQGWEHFNSLLKVFFFRRTQHGGHVDYSEEALLAGATKNKLRPIGRWLQRRMLWICGVGDCLFNTEEE